jgi:hypothetical protein
MFELSFEVGVPMASHDCTLGKTRKGDSHNGRHHKNRCASATAPLERVTICNLIQASPNLEIRQGEKKRPRWGEDLTI